MNALMRAAKRQWPELFRSKQEMETITSEKDMSTAAEIQMKQQYAAQQMGIANQLTPLQAAQQMQQTAGISAIYRGEDVKAKYRRTRFEVHEISNGYTVVMGEEVYFCEDIAAVSSRVSLILATQVLGE